MRQIPFVDLKTQYNSIKKDIDLALQKVINSTQFILGEEVIKFEKIFAKFIDVKYAVGMDNGLSALELGMRALQIGAGDEIITPVNSFIASSSAISFTGATPIFVDCDPLTYNIDVKRIEEKITKRTKAIMPVHLYGQPAEMDKISKIADKYKLFVVEDAAQAHGALYKERRAGSIGDFAAFSFYPSKNLGSFGDAGCFVTNKKKLFEKVLIMRNYGQRKKYVHEFFSWNRRLDTLQAAILIVKLKHLERWNKKRRAIAKTYKKLLRGLPIELPYELPNVTHVYHLFVIRTKQRDELKVYLESKGISTGIHYPVPIHLQPVYKNLGYEKGDFPIAENFAKEILSLPIYPELTKSEISKIAKTIKDFFK